MKLPRDLGRTFLNGWCKKLFCQIIDLLLKEPVLFAEHLLCFRLGIDHFTQGSNQLSLFRNHHFQL